MKVHVTRPAGRKIWVMRWTDPSTGLLRQQSTKTTNLRAAERLAAKLEESMAPEVERDVTWIEFCARYVEQRRGQLADASLRQFQSAASWIEADRRLDDIDGKFLGNLRERIRKERSVATSRSYVKMILAALGWAADQEYIAKRPTPRRERDTVGQRMARSRAVTEDEFRRILDAAGSDELRFAMRCLWHSGFRLAELLQLTWDTSQNWSLDESGRFPVVRITQQKSKRVQLQPITGEFWELILPTKAAGGRVVRGYSRADSLGAAVAKAGRDAGVMTDPIKRKYATSHDIGRRAFATRMGKSLSPMDLKTWMRHANIETTMRYYYQPDVQQLAEKGWD